jgi:hypothetical protein
MSHSAQYTKERNSAEDRERLSVHLLRAGRGQKAFHPIVSVLTGASDLLIFLIFILFICAYNVWVISPPFPPSPSLTPRYQAETILPLSLILL